MKSNQFSKSNGIFCIEINNISMISVWWEVEASNPLKYEISTNTKAVHVYVEVIAYIGTPNYY